MKNYELREPEFVDMEVALRINLYRAKSAGKVSESAGNAAESAGNAAGSAGKVPESAGNEEESAGKCRKVPENAKLTEQQEQIIGYISTNGQITSDEAGALLAIKQRRARAVLSDMVRKGWLAKTGASRGTRYVFPD